MAAESTVGITVGLIPRHYVLVVQAAIAPSAMVDLMATFAALELTGHGGLFDEGFCGGFFHELRTQCAEAYTGDLPAPIGAPIQEGGEDEGGVTAKTP
jgi:hypothetical protein